MCLSNIEINIREINEIVVNKIELFLIKFFIIFNLSKTKFLLIKIVIIVNIGTVITRTTAKKYP